MGEKYIKDGKVYETREGLESLFLLPDKEIGRVEEDRNNFSFQRSDVIKDDWDNEIGRIAPAGFLSDERETVLNGEHGKFVKAGFGSGVELWNKPVFKPDTPEPQQNKHKTDTSISDYTEDCDNSQIEENYKTLVTKTNSIVPPKVKKQITKATNLINQISELDEYGLNQLLVESNNKELKNVASLRLVMNKDINIFSLALLSQNHKEDEDLNSTAMRLEAIRRLEEIVNERPEMKPLVERVKNISVVELYYRIKDEPDPFLIKFKKEMEEKDRRLERCLEINKKPDSYYEESKSNDNAYWFLLAMLIMFIIVGIITLLFFLLSKFMQ